MRQRISRSGITGRLTGIYRVLHNGPYAMDEFTDIVRRDLSVFGLRRHNATLLRPLLP